MSLFAWFFIAFNFIMEVAMGMSTLKLLLRHFSLLSLDLEAPLTFISYLNFPKTYVLDSNGFH